MPEVERGSTRSHFLEKSLWKRLRACRKTDCVIKMKKMMIMMMMMIMMNFASKYSQFSSVNLNDSFFSSRIDYLAIKSIQMCVVLTTASSFSSNWRTPVAIRLDYLPHERGGESACTARRCKAA
jgi:hypothetical protein